MTCKIFLSFAGEAGWVQDFKASIQTHFNLADDEIYFYPDKRIGAKIRKEIEDNLKSAKIFIALLSDDYIRSPWCIYEHYNFTKYTSHGRGQVFAVKTPFLTGWPKNPDDRFLEEVLAGASRAISAQPDLDGENLRKHARGDWKSMLLSRYAELGSEQYKHVAPAVRGDLNAAPWRAIKKLLDDVQQVLSDSFFVPLPEELQFGRLAGFSAFALAADRYEEGGWGFSMRDDFAHDDEGDELGHGPFDLNVVVLKALGSFLPAELLDEEWGKGLNAAAEDHQLKPRATDRVPAVSKYLGLFELYPQMADGVMEYCRDIAEEIAKKPVNKRWDIQNARHAEPTTVIPYYHVLYYAFMLRAQEVSSSSVRFRVRLKTHVSDSELEDKVEELQRDVKEWLRANNLFRDMNEFLQFHEMRDATLEQLESRVHLIRTGVLWAVLSGSDAGRQLIREELENTLRRSKRWRFADFRDFDRLIEDLPQLVHGWTASDELFKGAFVSLLFVCALTLCSLSQAEGAQPAWQESYLRLRAALSKTMHGDLGVKLATQMNCLGWASAILLASLDKTIAVAADYMHRLWILGRRLRTTRVEAFQNATALQLMNAALYSKVEDYFSQQVLSEEAWTHSSLESDDQFIKPLVSRDASFWNKLKREPEHRTNESEAHIGGVLWVRYVRGRDEHGKLLNHIELKNGKIDLESDGYNQLFLIPFSRMTSMNVPHLLGIRREFGRADQNLVANVGEVVVKYCLFFDATEALCHQKFENRTETVVNKLLFEPHFAAFEDFLLLRDGYDGERWVQRSAIRRPNYGLKERTLERALEREFTISWHFLEIRPSVARQLGLAEMAKRLTKTEARDLEQPNSPGANIVSMVGHKRESGG